MARKIKKPLSWYARLAWKIATNPRKGFRELIKTNPMQGFYAIAAIPALINIVVDLFVNSTTLTPVMVIKEVLAAAVLWGVTVLSLIITAHILRIVGNKFLGGKAPVSHLKGLVAWVHVVQIPFFVILAFYNFDYLMMQPMSMSFIGAVLIIVPFITMVWEIIISVIGLAEIQHFSIGKAMGNYLLSILFIVVVGFALMFAVTFMTHIIPTQLLTY